MKFQHTPPVFDYKALRLTLGLIAFGLPWLVTAVAQTSLPSISASERRRAAPADRADSP